MSVPIERKIMEGYAIGHGINIGCGKVKLGNSIGVDTDPKARHVDTVADASFYLPFKNLDYILSLHSFEHMSRAPLLVLEEWLRVLKPGGVIAIIVPDGDRGMDAFYAGTGKHLNVFTLQTLLLLFQAAGMEIVECRKVDREPESDAKTLLCVGRKP